MSKQVFVTTEPGEDSRVYDADGFYVEGGFLFVTNGLDTVVTHRQWEHAEVRDNPDLTAYEGLPPLGKLKVVVDEAQQTRQESIQDRLNVDLKRLYRAVAKALADRERIAAGGCPCGRCGGEN